MRITYLKPLEVPTRALKGHQWLWETKSEVVCMWQDGERSGRVHVPAFYQTDGPSIPRLFRSLVPVTNIEWAASVVHDYLYENNIGSRRDADRIFRAGLAYTRARWGLSWVGKIRYWVKHQLMYVAVRVGGWAVWHR